MIVRSARILFEKDSKSHRSVRKTLLRLRNNDSSNHDNFFDPDHHRFPPYRFSNTSTHQISLTLRYSSQKEAIYTTINDRLSSPVDYTNNHRQPLDNPHKVPSTSSKTSLNSPRSVIVRFNRSQTLETIVFDHLVDPPTSSRRSHVYREGFLNEKLRASETRVWHQTLVRFESDDNWPGTVATVSLITGSPVSVFSVFRAAYRACVRPFASTPRRGGRKDNAHMPAGKQTRTENLVISLSLSPSLPPLSIHPRSKVLGQFINKLLYLLQNWTRLRNYPFRLFCPGFYPFVSFKIIDNARLDTRVEETDKYYLILYNMYYTDRVCISKASQLKIIHCCVRRRWKPAKGDPED